jgi:cystinosin
MLTESFAMMRREGQDLQSAGVYRFLFDATGYGYVLAWSISFYPQLILNWRRKSTQGMSIGFQWYNILGFFLYLVYTSFVPDATVQDQMFAAHALFITAFQLAQVPYFGANKLTDFPRVHGQTIGALLLALDLFLMANAAGMMSWVGLLYACGYLKTCISLVKYTPQLYLNFQRKSTVGFAMSMVFLDLTGGILSILQQFVQCAYDDSTMKVRPAWTWEPFIGNKPKMLLGMIAIGYDLAFLYQHFICYPEKPSTSTSEAPSAEASAIASAITATRAKSEHTS